MTSGSKGHFEPETPIPILLIGHPKSILILKNVLHFRQSLPYKILALAVFDYEDSKSESCHSAKTIREVFMYYKSPPPFFCNEKLIFHFPKLLYK